MAIGHVILDRKVVNHLRHGNLQHHVDRGLKQEPSHEKQDQKKEEE